MMTREFRDEWSAALRSGEYPQTAHTLHRVTPSHAPIGFCCLGVRCALDALKGLMTPDPQDEPTNVVRYWEGPNRRIAENKLDNELWAGEFIGSSMPPRVTLVRWGITDLADKLAGMNDSGKTFKEIADYLDSLEVSDESSSNVSDSVAGA